MTLEEINKMRRDDGLEPLVDLSQQICDICLFRRSNHQVNRVCDPNKYACCICYVRAGNPPSDWHTECMNEYRRLRKG